MAVMTTLKLTEALKSRIARLAKGAGKTQHAFMVEALEAETQRSELRLDFVGAALNTEQEVEQDGEVYSRDAVHRYFISKLAGKTPPKPKAIRLVFSGNPTRLAATTKMD